MFFLQYRISWSYLFYTSGMLFNTKLMATEPVTTIVQWRVNFILAP